MDCQSSIEPLVFSVGHILSAEGVRKRLLPGQRLAQQGFPLDELSSSVLGPALGTCPRRTSGRSQAWQPIYERRGAPAGTVWSRTGLKAQRRKRFRPVQKIRIRQPKTGPLKTEDISAKFRSLPGGCRLEVRLR